MTLGYVSFVELDSVKFSSDVCFWATQKKEGHRGLDDDRTLFFSLVHTPCMTGELDVVLPAVAFQSRQIQRNDTLVLANNRVLVY